MKVKVSKDKDYSGLLHVVLMGRFYMYDVNNNLRFIDHDGIVKLSDFNTMSEVADSPDAIHIYKGDEIELEF